MKQKIRLGLLMAAVMIAALPPAAEAAFPGKNGKIAFAGRAIWTVGPKGEHPKRLTRGFNPAFSASGRRIVFERPAPRVDRILVMKADGTRVRRRGRGYQPSFSPSGRRIVFSVLNRPGIKVMNADGSNRTRLTSGFDSEPVFSPNGKRILFVHAGPGADDIDLFVMRRDGSHKRPVTDNAAREREPAFSPDGDQIIFQRHRSIPGQLHETGTDDIYRIDVDGSNETLIRRNGITPAFSPNGRRIAFGKLFWPRNCPSPGACEIPDSRLAIMNADGSGVRRVERAPGGDPDWGPKVEPRR